jgi:FkbM family methyltransferase
MEADIPHLEKLASNHGLCKKHLEYLQKLKKEGFEPKVVYDIGSCTLHWTREVQTLWPDAIIILFDAYEPLEVLYKDFDHYIGVLSNEDGNTVRFYVSKEHPSGNSYYKEFNDDVFPITRFVERKTRTLDGIVAERGFPPPDFIKLDTQGSEKDILEGATETLKSVKRMIVEIQSDQYNIGAPRTDIVVPFVESLGFNCTAPLFCDYGPDGDYGFERL